MWYQRNLIVGYSPVREQDDHWSTEIPVSYLLEMCLATMLRAYLKLFCVKNTLIPLIYLSNTYQSHFHFVTIIYNINSIKTAFFINLINNNINFIMLNFGHILLQILLTFAKHIKEFILRCLTF